MSDAAVCFYQTTGLVLRSCPWFLTHRSRAVADVATWWGWRKDGCLNPFDPRLSVPMRKAIEAFAAGFSAGEAARAEAMNKKGRK